MLLIFKKEVFSVKVLIYMMIFVFLLGCSSGIQEKQLQSSYEYYQSGEDEFKYKQPVKNEVEKKDLPQKVTKKILDVPMVNQNPELKYGCEVTSLAMVLQYAGIKIDKMTLANQLQKDNDKLVRRSGDIIKWGDPNIGFVGDMTGNGAGYAVFDKPLEKLMRNYLGDRVINLTGKDFSQLLKQIDNNKPVIVWTTGDHKLPDRWESWLHEGHKIKTPLDLHVVVLVGYDEGSVYINDPLSGDKTEKVNIQTFIGSWDALKKRALSYN